MDILHSVLLSDDYCIDNILISPVPRGTWHSPGHGPASPQQHGHEALARGLPRVEGAGPLVPLELV